MIDQSIHHDTSHHDKQNDIGSEWSWSQSGARPKTGPGPKWGKKMK